MDEHIRASDADRDRVAGRIRHRMRQGGYGPPWGRGPGWGGGPAWHSRWR